MMRVLVIIPVYNEAEALPGVLYSLHRECPDYNLLVVNDASTDDSGRIAEGLGLATVLHLSCNLGIGGCVQTGFRYAVEKGYDIAVQFDGDGQHNTADVAHLVSIVASGEADVAIGSRFNIRDSAGFRSTNLRRIGIRLFQATSYLLIRQKITDHTSGFRAYNRKALIYLAEHYPVDYPEPEMIVTLGRKGFRIKETFSQMFERQGGASSIPLRKGPYYMLKVLLSMLMAAVKD
jgi:glycosyltransferase involved in cell wall biosynthesis